MFDRIIGVVKLDRNIFKEIELDHKATFQAMFIVIMVALISSLGSGINASLRNQSFFTSFFISWVWSFFGWIIWSVISHFIGSAFFGSQGTLMGMLRVIGYAYIPQVLGIIPYIGGVIGWIWAVLVAFVAVRQDFYPDNLKAFFTIIIGFCAYIAGYAFILFFVLPAH